MGLIASIYSESFPPKSKFSVDNIPDLTGKVIIVTGGAVGIGKETTKALLTHNAKVYIATRNQIKTEEAIRELQAQTGKEAFFLKVDLADLKSIKAAAQDFLQRENQLHVLFNNGGVMVPPIDQFTTDGYDLQFGTNVLGHFYLTKLLLPIMIETAQSTGTSSRVINTSSSASLFVSNLDFSTFKESSSRKKAGIQKLYAYSKFGNVVFAKELARRFGEKGIVSISLNPGNIKTDLQRHVPSIQKALLNAILYKAPFGALTQLYGGTSPDAERLNGQYLIPWARVGTPQSGSQNPKLGQELWTWLEEQVASI